MAMMTRIVAFTLLLEQIPASLHPATNPDPVNINTIICGSKRNFTESKGVIQSPGYPSRYPANVLCTYEINVDYGMRVELTWKDFDVDGAMPDCDTAGGDYVQVYTGCGNNRHSLTRFCTINSAIPHSLYSVDNCLSLQFYASPQALPKTSKGFSAEYKAVNASSMLVHQHCNRTLISSSGVIHSTLWPRTDFRDYDFCNWHLKAEQPMVFQLTIMDLDIYNPYGSCNRGSGLGYKVIVQGSGSLYVSKPSRIEFTGSCKPFTYLTLSYELVITWARIKQRYSWLKKRGFIIGYVTFRPVENNIADWQYGLIAAAAILTLCAVILFACRKVNVKRQISRQQGFKIFVDASTETTDVPMVRVDEGEGCVTDAQEDEGRAHDAEVPETENFRESISSEDDLGVVAGHEVLYHPAPCENPRMASDEIHIQMHHEEYRNDQRSAENRLIDESPWETCPTLTDTVEERIIDSDVPTGTTAIQDLSVQQPYGRDNQACTDEAMEQVGEKKSMEQQPGVVLRNDERCTTHENSHQDTCPSTPDNPPSYEDIFSELESLSRIVAEIVSDIE